MITLTELNKKARRPWTSGVFLKSWLQGDDFFPLDIPFKTPSGRTLSNEFIRVRDWISELHHHSKLDKGSGYQLNYRTINHQQLGQQRIPAQIRFETQTDWLSYINQQAAFKHFESLVAVTKRQLPQAMPLVQGKPLKLLEYAGVWEQLIKVCRYFQLNPLPERYIRQLDIQGVDTKFIESHKGILSELLCLALEPEDFDDTVKGIVENSFERRFGLLYDEPLIRFRILDRSEPVTDMSVPLSQFIDPGVGTVYITENKVNGLTFPQRKDAIVVFGLGYGIRSLFSVAWLENKRIIYWGDIDTHGFSILSQLRSRFSQTQSLLMDRKTLDQHVALSGQEPEAKRHLSDLANLTVDEAHFYDDLRLNRIGENVRLEQERIRFSRLRQALEEQVCLDR